MAKKEVERKPIKAKAEVSDVEAMDDFERGLILDMNKEFEESSMILDDTDRGQVTAWIPSGNPWLDYVLGGGWPGGRVVEVFGPESNGKTTVALHCLAEAQRMGGTAIFLDTEHALDKRRAQSIGVNLKRLVYAQPETMEQLFAYVEKTIEVIKKKDPNRLVVIVWDSVAATPTQSEIDGEYGDAVMGIHARIMSQAFRKITKIISKNKVLFMCINQIRDKMNVSYGDKTSTFGGRALKFYSTIRLEVKRVGMYKEGNDIKGIDCEATVKKNKVAPPFGVAKFKILFQDIDGGMDKYHSILDGGDEHGLFGSTKGWFEYNDKKYRRADIIQYMKDNPDEYEKIKDTFLSLV